MLYDAAGAVNRLRGASELVEKSLRKAILTSGIHNQNRRHRSEFFGSTQKMSRLFEIGEWKLLP